MVWPRNLLIAMSLTIWGGANCDSVASTAVVGSARVRVHQLSPVSVRQAHPDQESLPLSHGQWAANHVEESSGGPDDPLKLAVLESVACPGTLFFQDTPERSSRRFAPQRLGLIAARRRC